MRTQYSCSSHFQTGTPVVVEKVDFDSKVIFKLQSKRLDERSHSSALFQSSVVELDLSCSVALSVLLKKRKRKKTTTTCLYSSSLGLYHGVVNVIQYVCTSAAQR